MRNYNTAQKLTLNTIFLYAKQMLSMIVSLYTVRIVLRVLGTEDYGIYNVIAGIVATLGFVSNSMANASQRYFSFELGKNNKAGLSNIFSMTILSYAGIILIIILFSESIGVWYIKNRMLLPAGRSNAAFAAFQCVIATFTFSFVSSPFIALIIANENMSVFSIVSIFESIAKLLMAFILVKINFDKLILYSFLMIFPSLISFCIYIAFCHGKYRYVRFIRYWNWNKIKEMYVYTFSNLGGSVINIFKIQVLNLVINQKFSSKVVAARGIATNISGIIQSFSVNFTTAISPFITKEYAQGRNQTLYDFLTFSCKISYFINFIIALPAVLEMEYLLELWLKIPPEYSVLFSKLVIIDCCIDSLTLPLMVGIQATGRISKYVLSMSVLNLLYVPCCLALFGLGLDASSALAAAPFFTFGSIFIRVHYICKNMKYSFVKFFLKIFAPASIVSLCASFISSFTVRIFTPSFFRLCFTTFVSIIFSAAFIFILGLNKSERNIVILKLKSWRTEADI